jgi:hypothetical protein
MRVLGVEFNARKLLYVLVDGDGEFINVVAKNWLELPETRSRDALVAFQVALCTVYTSAKPDMIAIKEKPESGAMQAGAAALKMEGIALANAPCRVVFVSGARINKCDTELEGLPKYYGPALKCALVAIGSVK